MDFIFGIWVLLIIVMWNVSMMRTEVKYLLTDIKKLLEDINEDMGE